MTCACFEPVRGSPLPFGCFLAEGLDCGAASSSPPASSTWMAAEPAEREELRHRGLRCSSLQLLGQGGEAVIALSGRGEDDQLGV